MEEYSCQRHYYFAKKGLPSQSYDFSSSHVWMWQLDYVLLEKTLESPLDCKRSNQYILKEISPEYSLEGLMLKLKLQYSVSWCKELTPRKRPWCWERLKAGGEGDNRGWDGWMASLTQWTWVWVSSGSWWRTGRPGLLQSLGSQHVGHDWATQLNSLLLN